MNRTYEEILESMKNAYFEEYGAAPEESSQTMKRFEILASELFSLSCYGDYIFRQAFVQTASGENLDKMGELRGCIRKTAQVSEGELTFSISEASEENIIIPVDTVCSVEGKPYLQFATTEEGVIAAGETSVTVSAVSLEAGSEYNVDENTVTIMVNAPVGINSVHNEYAFAGGYSDENDEAYRNRILRHYNILPNGINCTSCENMVLTLDYVIDCKIIPATSTAPIKIIVTTKSGTIDSQQKIEIARKIPFIDATNANYEVYHSVIKPVSFNAYACVLKGYDTDDMTARIRERIDGVFSAIRPGDTLYPSSLDKAVVGIEGLVSCTFSSPYAKRGYVPVSTKEIVTISKLTVTYVYD